MGRQLTGPRRRAMRATGLIVLVTAAGVAAAVLLLPLAVRAFVRVLDFTLNGCLVLAALLSNGADGWTIVVTVGRAAGRGLMQTRALTVIGILIVVSALALYGLQRLLGSDEELSP
jgi:hypothetical protein